MKKAKNKQIENTDEKVEKKVPKRSWTFPQYGITIKANSLDEAKNELEKRLEVKKNKNE